MNWLIAGLLAGLAAGFGTCFFTLVRSQKKLSVINGLKRAAEAEVAFIAGLNSKFKTVERGLGTCECGIPLSVVDVVPESLELASTFMRKVVMDPATHTHLHHYRAQGASKYTRKS